MAEETRVSVGKDARPVRLWQAVLVGSFLIAAIVFMGVRAFSTPSIGGADKIEAGPTPVEEP